MLLAVHRRASSTAPSPAHVRSASASSRASRCGSTTLSTAALPSARRAGATYDVTPPGTYGGSRSSSQRSASRATRAGRSRSHAGPTGFPLCSGRIRDEWRDEELGHPVRARRQRKPAKRSSSGTGARVVSRDADERLLAEHVAPHVGRDPAPPRLVELARVRGERGPLAIDDRTHVDVRGDQRFELRHRREPFGTRLGELRELQAERLEPGAHRLPVPPPARDQVELGRDVAAPDRGDRDAVRLEMVGMVVAAGVGVRDDDVGPVRLEQFEQPRRADVDRDVAERIGMVLELPLLHARSRGNRGGRNASRPARGTRRRARRGGWRRRRPGRGRVRRASRDPGPSPISPFVQVTTMVCAPSSP